MNDTQRRARRRADIAWNWRPSSFQHYQGDLVNTLNGYDYEDLQLGMTASYAKTITETDIELFATASGDNNAIHLDEDFAKTTPFGGRIAHGMLTASVISAALASRLPGPGSIYLSQNLRFRAPVKPGETVHVTVTVTDLQPEKRRVALSTVCMVQDKVVVDGDALIMPTSAKRREQ
ncbi:MAG TPA: (R)-hydratase [Cupriavidus sp.]|nr:(R)-hydratase [Cupriavidus sp.]